jgi:oligopeptide/dipeptide ABC transporter ATP-binding protein
MTVVLQVSDLVVEMRRHRRRFRAVDEVSLTVDRGGSLGIVGESGCGKSLTLRAIMGLLPSAGRVLAGTVSVDGEPLSADSRRAGRDRRHRLSMVFQDALSALNPVMTVGAQIAEAPRLVLGLSRKAARVRALELLRVVGIPDPQRRYGTYPHELSGGLRQRVMIAIALSSEPAILLCDEPTTALDVTIQAQILALLADLRVSSGLTILFVTHDLGVVGQVCDDLAVMYAGRIVETGPAAEVLAAPRHPYTAGLLASALDVDNHDSELVTIPGSIPDPLRLPPGCPFHPRCPFAQPDCRVAAIPMRSVAPGRASACLHHERLLEVPAANAYGIESRKGSRGRPAVVGRNPDPAGLESEPPDG